MRCEECGKVTPSYDIVHYGSIESGYRDLCGRCVNADIARRCGVEDFEHGFCESDLQVAGDHAFLLSPGRRLPFPTRKPVFEMT
jgi:hypothetical protein